MLMKRWFLDYFSIEIMFYTSMAQSKGNLQQKTSEWNSRSSTKPRNLAQMTLIELYNYNRTDQFIRAQVRKQSPEWSNHHTWTHINPVVNWNHEGFETNLHTTKIAVIQHNKPHVISISQVVHKYLIHRSSHSYYNMSSQIVEAK